MANIIPNDRKNTKSQIEKDKIKNGKSIKDDYPEIEDLMFGNKELIKKETNKKKYKEWLKNNRKS